MTVVWGFFMPPQPEPKREPEPEPEPTKEQEQDRVRAWRVLQAAALGYEWCDAVQLADSDADLHELADLIERGCPHSLAARIV